MTPIEVLLRHVDAFNRGIETGDFAEMVDGFREDATLEFVNIPVGPFRGRADIRVAYAANPPTEQIRLLRSRSAENGAIGEYAWSSRPEERGGDLILHSAGGEIQKLTIVYGGPPTQWDGF